MIRTRAWKWGVASLAAFAMLMCWEVIARAHLIVEGDSLPPATSSIAALGTLMTEQSFWVSVFDTLQAALIGLAIAIVLGVPCGALVGLSRLAFRSTRLLVEFLRPIPPVVIIPLLLLTLGPSKQMGLFLVVFGCFWPIFIQTTYGVKEADPVALDTARSFGIGPAGQVFQVVLPSAMPFVATGIRVAAGAAFVIAIVSELIGGAPGLGKDILLAQNSGQFARTYALVLATGILGLLLYAGIGVVERRRLHWHPSMRSGVRS